MPPPVEDLSDEESGDVPFSTAKDESIKGKEEKENGDDNENNDSEDDDSEDEEEGVFIVEKIVEHNFTEDGVLLLRVKWKGYESAKDLTWEPEEGLMDGAHDIVAAYYKKIGGRPKKPSVKAAPKPAAKSGPGRKRKSLGETKSTPPAASQTATKKRRKPAAASETPAETEGSDDDNDNWLPKGDNWDSEVKCVDTIVRDEEDDSNLFALLLWTNGKKTKVSVETCYDKCPKKMLKFYEQHLVFKN